MKNSAIILLLLIFCLSHTHGQKQIKGVSPVYSFTIKKGVNTVEIKGTSPNYSFDLANKSSDNSPPELSLIYPPMKRGFKQIVDKKQITLVGLAEDPNGIYEVFVNGKEAVLDSEGRFHSDIFLVVGDNKVTIKATDGRMNTIIKDYIIERKGDEIVDNSVHPVGEEIIEGNYFALIIGINEYDDPNIVSLDRPIRDAEKIHHTLTNYYTFDYERTTFLKNPSRAALIDALDKLSQTLTPKDNLLVFFAGHGYWDEDRQFGYWLPSDARKTSTANWFRNSTLSEYIGSINTNHTLLIADACFSGSIFKTRKAFNDAPASVKKLYELPSRKAMTSGTLKEVPDISVFVQYLNKRLIQNQQKYLSATQLFTSFRDAVLNNSPNVPQFGEIRYAGDEGGDFIFIKR